MNLSLGKDLTGVVQSLEHRSCTPLCLYQKTKYFTKVYSNSNNSEVELVTDMDTDPIPFVKITCGNFVACKYDGHWWMGCVIDKIDETEEMKISFLHPHGPSASFSFSRHLDNLIVKSTDVITTLNPKTATGRTYILPPSEMLLCSRLVQKK